MPAAIYQHRVTIQAVASFLTEWAAGRKPGLIWPRSGRGSKPSRARSTSPPPRCVNSVSHRVTMRYRSDLTPTLRLIFEGRTLGIEAVLPDERKSRLVVMCTEQV